MGSPNKKLLNMMRAIKRIKLIAKKLATVFIVLIIHIMTAKNSNIRTTDPYHRFKVITY